MGFPILTAPVSPPPSLRADAAPKAPETTRYVYPADVVATREPTLFSTILGSCVAVCLWDRRRGWGGMSHHLLPNGPADGERAARFGNVAVEQLIADVTSLGSDHRDLVAKVFGGARVLRAFSGPNALLGDRNAEAALRALADRRIPVAARHTGGRRGRKLRFSTTSGTVLLVEL
jgi:chemotaxis protein CheD